jgi:hypothetical protein
MNTDVSDAWARRSTAAMTLDALAFEVLAEEPGDDRGELVGTGDHS